ncbi:MAG: hypothetical protein ACI9QQ_001799, partial [Myxococcota bacterium]
SRGAAVLVADSPMHTAEITMASAQVVDIFITSLP